MRTARCSAALAPGPDPQRPLTFCLWHGAEDLEYFQAETTKVPALKLDLWLWEAVEPLWVHVLFANERAGLTRRFPKFPVKGSSFFIQSLVLQPSTGNQYSELTLSLKSGERFPDDGPGHTFTEPWAVRRPGRRGGVSVGPKLPVSRGACLGDASFASGDGPRGAAGVSQSAGRAHLMFLLGMGLTGPCRRLGTVGRAFSPSAAPRLLLAFLHWPARFVL